MCVVLHSLNISRGEIFADFAVWEIISKNFILEIFSPPYSLIRDSLGVFANMQNFIFNNTAQPQKFAPQNSLYGMCDGFCPQVLFRLHL